MTVLFWLTLCRVSVDMSRVREILYKVEFLIIFESICRSLL